MCKRKLKTLGVRALSVAMVCSMLMGNVVFANDIVTYNSNVESQEEQSAQSSYTVRWLDMDGNELASEVREGTVGAEVSIEEADKSMEGYEFISDSEQNIVNCTVSEDGSAELLLYFSEIVQEEEPEEDAQDENVSNSSVDDNQVEDSKADTSGDSSTTPEEIGGTEENAEKDTNNKDSDESSSKEVVTYLVEWKDPFDKLIKSEERKANLGEEVSVTEEDKNFDNKRYFFNGEADYNVLEGIASEGLVLVMYFDDTQAVAPAYGPHEFHFVVDMRPYGGTKTDKVYYNIAPPVTSGPHGSAYPGEMTLYDKFDWSEANALFNWSFKEYTCSEAMHDIGGAWTTQYWGTFWGENKTDQKNCKWYFGYGKDTGSVIYWNATPEPSSVVPKSGIRVDAVFEGELSKTVQGKTKAFTPGSQPFLNLDDYAPDVSSILNDDRYICTFEGYELVSGSGKISGNYCELKDDYTTIRAKYSTTSNCSYKVNVNITGDYEEFIEGTKKPASPEDSYSIAPSTPSKTGYAIIFDNYEIVEGSATIDNLEYLSSSLRHIDGDVVINANYKAVSTDKKANLVVDYAIDGDKDLTTTIDYGDFIFRDTETVNVVKNDKLAELYPEWYDVLGWGYACTGMKLLEGNCSINERTGDVTLYGEGTVHLKCDLTVYNTKNGTQCFIYFRAFVDEEDFVWVNKIFLPRNGYNTITVVDNLLTALRKQLYPNATYDHTECDVLAGTTSTKDTELLFHIPSETPAGTCFECNIFFNSNDPKDTVVLKKKVGSSNPTTLITIPATPGKPMKLEDYMPADLKNGMNSTIYNKFLSYTDTGTGTFSDSTSLSSTYTPASGENIVIASFEENNRYVTLKTVISGDQNRTETKSTGSWTYGKRVPLGSSYSTSGMDTSKYLYEFEGFEIESGDGKLIGDPMSNKNTDCLYVVGANPAVIVAKFKAYSLIDAKFYYKLSGAYNESKYVKTVKIPKNKEFVISEKVDRVFKDDYDLVFTDYSCGNESVVFSDKQNLDSKCTLTGDSSSVAIYANYNSEFMQDRYYLCFAMDEDDNLYGSLDTFPSMPNPIASKTEEIDVPATTIKTGYLSLYGWREKGAEDCLFGTSATKITVDKLRTEVHPVFYGHNEFINLYFGVKFNYPDGTSKVIDIPGAPAVVGEKNGKNVSQYSLVDSSRLEYALTQLENGSDYTTKFFRYALDSSQTGSFLDSKRIDYEDNQKNAIFTWQPMNDDISEGVEDSKTYAKVLEIYDLQEITKLEYHSNGGTEVAPVFLDGPGSVMITRRNPVKEGYFFKGWSLDEEAQFVDYIGGDSISIDSGIVRLYAVWSDTDDSGNADSGSGSGGGGQPSTPAQKYTLTYVTGTDASIDSQKSTSGSFLVTRRQPTKEGYTFVGWSTTENPSSSAEVDYIGGDTIPAVEDLTLYGVFEKNKEVEKHVLTYDTVGGSSVPSTTPDDGFYMVTRRTPTKEGYTFIGWSTETNSTDIDYIAGDKISALSDVTLYAVWLKNVKPVTFNLYYDSEGGTEVEPTESVDGKFMVTRRTPIKEGKIFLGWSLKANDTDIDYIAGDFILANANKQLYAVYVDAKPVTPEEPEEVKTYTLTYDTLGGDAISPSKSSKGMFFVTRNVPVKEDYTFVGWSLIRTDNVNRVDYLGGDWFDATEDTTLYAIYKQVDESTSPEEKTYTLTYDTKSGSTVKSTVSVDGSFFVTRNVPVLDGNEFLGWSLTKDSTQIDYLGGDSFKATADTTLYAVYKKITKPDTSVEETYIITYKAPSIAPTKSIDGEFRVTRNEPIVEGKDFLGWSLTEGSEQVDYVGGDTFKAVEDITLYPVFKDKEEPPTPEVYTITYETRGGGEIKKTESKDGIFTVTRNMPELVGKVFVGWTLNKESESTRDLDYIGGDTFKAEGNITLYALYEDALKDVVVNTNGGSDVETNVTVVNNKYVINITIPNKPGYDFPGWDTDGDGKPDVDPENPIETDNPEAPIDAVWSLKVMPTQYVTTVDSEWEPGVDFDTVSQDLVNSVFTLDDSLVDMDGRAGVTINKEEPTRPGYTFKGWSLGQVLLSNEDMIYMPGDTLYLDELDSLYEMGMRFTALWEPVDDKGDNSGDASGDPSGDPSKDPNKGDTSGDVSGDPDKKPSGDTSGDPSGDPDKKPDDDKKPSGDTSGDPNKGDESDDPDKKPSGDTSEDPSGDPDKKPSGDNSGDPSDDPDKKPSGDNSGDPDKNQDDGKNPSGDNSGDPDKKPDKGDNSGDPSGDPNKKPSGDTSSDPDKKPGEKPSGDPINKPNGTSNSTPGLGNKPVIGSSFRKPTKVVSSRSKGSGYSRKSTRKSPTTGDYTEDTTIPTVILLCGCVGIITLLKRKKRA